MSRGWQRYHSPQTIEDAVALLRSYDGHARVIGGGTDLLVETRRGLRKPIEAVVDATAIRGLDSISKAGGYIVLGCGVTHSMIVSDPLVLRHGACLAESCGVIGGPQVRNVGTLAGNVAHALPAGDGIIGLLALGGDIEVAGEGGRRWMPMQDSFVGPGRSTVYQRREIITRLRFKPTGDAEGSAHHRVMRPQGLCLPIISMAARVRLTGDGRIAQARISMGPVGPVPWLAEPAMAVLEGGPPTAGQFEKATEAALANVSLRASKYRATHEYRSQMVREFLPAILKRAVQRAVAAA